MTALTANERAEVEAEIQEIRARADRLRDRPLVHAERRAEYLAEGEREIERLQGLLRARA